MSLVDVVVEVHDQLDSHSVAHAFGGALALGYLIEPRGTVDVDVNVFTTGSEADVQAAALAALGDLGFTPELDSAAQVPLAGIRLRRQSDPVPIDLFPPLDHDRYARVAERCVRHPFGRAGEELPFLSAEDLTVFKLSFGRDRDWVDLRRIAAARPDLDVEYVEEQLIGLRGHSMYPRVARLRSMLRPVEA